MTGRHPLWCIDLVLHKFVSQLQSVPMFTRKVKQRSFCSKSNIVCSSSGIQGESSYRQ